MLVVHNDWYIWKDSISRFWWTVENGCSQQQFSVMHTMTPNFRGLNTQSITYSINNKCLGLFSWCRTGLGCKSPYKFEAVMKWLEMFILIRKKIFSGPPECLQPTESKPVSDRLRMPGRIYAAWRTTPHPDCYSPGLWQGAYATGQLGAVCAWCSYPIKKTPQLQCCVTQGSR